LVIIQNEKKKSKPYLKLSIYYPKKGIGKKVSAIYIVANNKNHIDIDVKEIEIEYYHPHKSSRELTKKTRFYSWISSFVPFLSISYDKLTDKSTRNPKLTQICKYTNSSVYTEPDGSIPEEYCIGFPDVIHGYGNATIAIKCNDLLSYMKSEINKNGQKFSIGLVISSGRTFTTIPISIRKLKNM